MKTLGKLNFDHLVAMFEISEMASAQIMAVVWELMHLRGIKNMHIEQNKNNSEDKSIEQSV